MIAGPGHAPLSQFALWKEGLLGLILLLAFIELLQTRKWWKVDMVDILILLLLVLGFGVSIFNAQFSMLNVVFGFRYDFIPLIAFGILRRVEWSDLWLQKSKSVLLVVGSIIAGYGIISFFLSAEFFQWLGYSNLHSLYIPNGPLAPFQLIGETGLRRIQSTMSGPNQLGLWLLIPLAIVASSLKLQASSKKKNVQLVSCSLCLVLALFLTFSRAAWIGAFVLSVITLSPVVARMPRKVMVSLSAAIVVLAVAAVTAFPSVILRFSSTKGHIEGPIQAVQKMIAHPLGLGLGTAGPASNRVSDACVLLNEGDDPAWAHAHPNLCVFVGDTQVQPIDRYCSCPFLPENWYLQIGVEMGWAGLVLYLTLMGVVFYRLRSVAGWQVGRLHVQHIQPATCNICLSFVALSTAALFLHAFEDSATAYTLWLLIAALLPVARSTQNS